MCARSFVLSMSLCGCCFSLGVYTASFQTVDENIYIYIQRCLDSFTIIIFEAFFSLLLLMFFFVVIKKYVAMII